MRGWKETEGMRFAMNIANFGSYVDPRLVAELAHEAEESGWDGFFIWDHVNYVHPETGEYFPVADPWITMAAVALHTKRIRFGPIVTPLPQRRPWRVAREAATLDQLSGGRLILGLGIGTNHSGEYSAFGESAEPKVHAAMLDEGLEILTGLWSGEAFDYDGEHYHLTNARFIPTPVQQPRIPLWIAAYWPNKRPFRRAARWDGVCPLRPGSELTAEDFREILAYIKQHRTSESPFDVLASGLTTGTDPAEDGARMTRLAEAGVTWWQELCGWRTTVEQVRKRIRQGPPRLSS